MRDEQTWLKIAREDIGLKEIPGAKTAPKILGWLQTLKVWWTDDETPWCGIAMAAWMRAADIDPPKAFYRAKAWLDWGIKVDCPVVGAVVIFTRDGGGHVGLIVGKDQRGRLLVLGGNQGNAVSVVPFDMARVDGYRFPPGQQHQFKSWLHTYASADASSTNEA